MADSFTFGDFRLDVVEKKLWERRGGDKETEAPLAPKDFQVLELLVTEAPTIVSRNAIKLKVWGTAATKDQSIIESIRKIRAALADKKPYKYIITSGKGYKFRGFEIRELQYSFSLMVDDKPRAFWLAHNRGGVREHFRDEFFETAREIEFHGVCLWEQWFARPNFQDIMFERLNRMDLDLRVVLPWKKSEFLQLFSADWAYKHKGKARFNEVKDRFYDIHAGTDSWLQRNAPKCVKYLYEETVTCGIVRCDNLMVVGVYTWPHHGGQHGHILLNRVRQPVTVEEKEAALLFKQYKERFGLLWGIAKRREDIEDSNDVGRNSIVGK